MKRKSSPCRKQCRRETVFSISSLVVSWKYTWKALLSSANVVLLSATARRHRFAYMVNCTEVSCDCTRKFKEASEPVQTSTNTCHSHFCSRLTTSFNREKSSFLWAWTFSNSWSCESLRTGMYSILCEVLVMWAWSASHCPGSAVVIRIHYYVWDSRKFMEIRFWRHIGKAFLTIRSKDFTLHLRFKTESKESKYQFGEIAQPFT